MTTDQSSLGSNVVGLFSKSTARDFENRSVELASHTIQLAAVDPLGVISAVHASLADLNEDGGAELQTGDPEMAEPDHPTREEMNAKLEATEARLEVRFVQIDGKLDRLVDKLGGLSGLLGDVRDETKRTRITIVVTVVGAVVAGLAALYTSQSNLLQAFQTGLTVQSGQSVAPDTSTVSPLRLE